MALRVFRAAQQASTSQPGPEIRVRSPEQLLKEDALSGNELAQAVLMAQRARTGWDVPEEVQLLIVNQVHSPCDDAGVWQGPLLRGNLRLVCKAWKKHIDHQDAQFAVVTSPKQAKALLERLETDIEARARLQSLCIGFMWQSREDGTDTIEMQREQSRFCHHVADILELARHTLQRIALKVYDDSVGPEADGFVHHQISQMTSLRHLAVVPLAAGVYNSVNVKYVTGLLSSNTHLRSLRIDNYSYSEEDPDTAPDDDYPFAVWPESLTSLCSVDLQGHPRTLLQQIRDLGCFHFDESFDSHTVEASADGFRIFKAALLQPLHTVWIKQSSLAGLRDLTDDANGLTLPELRMMIVTHAQWTDESVMADDWRHVHGLSLDKLELLHDCEQDRSGAEPKLSVLLWLLVAKSISFRHLVLRCTDRKCATKWNPSHLQTLADWQTSFSHQICRGTDLGWVNV